MIYAALAALFFKKFFSVSAPSRVLLATVADAAIPQRGALVYRQQRFALVRENETVYALSLVCTHLGCTLSVTPHGLSCPCHGSLFDPAGGVIKGPADLPLPRLHLEQRDDQWLIYG